MKIKSYFTHWPYKPARSLAASRQADPSQRFLASPCVNA